MYKTYKVYEMNEIGRRARNSSSITRPYLIAPC